MVGLGLYDEWWTKSGFGKDYSELCNVSADMIEEIYNKYVQNIPTLSTAGTSRPR